MLEKVRVTNIGIRVRMYKQGPRLWTLKESEPNSEAQLMQLP